MRLWEAIGRVSPQSRRLWALVIGLTALRLVAGGLIHLTEDEAYYRLWSLSPQAGYYDHPPMIAWWIWIGRHLVGEHALGVRLLAILAAAVQTLLVYDGVRLVGQTERVALRAALWFNATLLIAFGSILAIPDAPAGLFWTVAVWCVLKALNARPALWWCAAGAAAGLACLSKYSALFLAPGILLWLLVDPAARRQLARPWPWLAIPIAAGLFAVNVAWNAGHDWQSFHKQFGRVAAAGLSAKFTLELVVSQLVLLNPLIAMFCALGIRRAALGLRQEGATRLWAPYLAVSAPFIAYLLIHSLHDRVQAHWPAPLYPGLAAAAAIAAEGVTAKGWMDGLRKAAAMLGLGAGALALVYLALPIPSPLGRADPAHAVRGWSDFASRLEALRRKSGAAWIGTVSYGEAAELASEPGLKAPVLQLTERDRYRFLRPVGDLRQPGLAIDLDRRLDAAALSTCFRQVRALGHLRRTDEKHGLYAVYSVADPIRIVDGGCSDTRNAGS